MRPDDHFQEVETSTLLVPESSSSHFPSSAASAPTKIVVADTSPLNYLVQIRCDHLLPLLYRRVIIPPVVLSELTHSGAPHAVAEWAVQPPTWLEVLPLTTQPDDRLKLLDAGERDAIQLAIELEVAEVLIDEFKGRREAQARGLFVVGTLGVLIAGDRANLIDARQAFERLTEYTNIYVSPQLRMSFMDSLRSASSE